MKLDIDFGSALGLGGGMDANTRDLIVQLCTKAGMIMEDASPIALSIGTSSDTEAVIGDLVNALDRASQLLKAARMLVS